MDFSIDDRNYRVDMLSAKQQWHLSRKLAPLLPPLAPILVKLAGAQGVEDSFSRSVLEFAELAEPFTEALASMKDADADYVWDLTLGSVKVETTPGTWMPLWMAGAKATVIELDDLSKLLPVMLKVIEHNLGPFISGFLTSHGEPAVTGSSGDTSPVRKIG